MNKEQIKTLKKAMAMVNYSQGVDTHDKWKDYTIAYLAGVLSGISNE